MAVSSLGLVLLLNSSALASAEVPPDLASVVLEREIAAAPKDVVLCIEVDGRNPKGDLVRTLQRPDRTIVAASQCKRVVDVRRGSYERTTHHRAHFLTVYHAKWTTSSTVHLEAEEYFDGLWASHWSVTAHLADGTWNIDVFHLDWES